MSSRLVCLFLFVLTAVHVGFAVAQEGAETSDWKTCPDGFTGGKLTEWREKLVKQVVLGNYSGAIEAINKCFPAKAPNCYSNLTYYADSKLNPNAYPDYFTPTKEELTVKSPADLPDAFQPKDASGKVMPDQIQIPKDILVLAKEKKWPTVLYKTRSSGGFNNGGNLFMVAITNPDFDIFIQTSPHRNNDGDNLNPVPNPSNGDITNAQSILTVITVDKKQKPPVGQMRKLYASDTSATGQRTYGWSNNTEDPSSCYECHTGPLRPISPLGYKNVNQEKPMSAEQEAQVDAMNLLLEQPVTWQTTKRDGKVLRSGPPMDNYPLGWAPQDSFTRKEEFLKKCSTYPELLHYSRGDAPSVTLKQNKPPQIDYQKLASAMNCIECHNNSNRGILHESFSSNEMHFKVNVDRSMPRNVDDLNQDERLALVNCLQAERTALKAEWKKSGEWMKLASCFGDQFDGKPPKVINVTGPNNTNNKKNKSTNQN